MIDQRKPESVEHFEYFGSIKNYGREIKTSIVMQEQLSAKRRFCQQILLKFKDEISKMLHLEHSWYGAENCTLRKVEHNTWNVSKCDGGRG